MRKTPTPQSPQQRGGVGYRAELQEELVEVGAAVLAQPRILLREAGVAAEPVP